MDRVREIIGLEHITGMYHTGAHITVAVLDTGIASHVDFDERIIGFCDLINHRDMPYDDNGHGTHIAGIIAGSGAFSGGRFAGVAPTSQLVVCKVLNRRGDGTTAHIIQGIRWCIRHRKEYNIRVMNISVGMLESTKKEEQEELEQEVVRAWDYGIVVITAAGNNGPATESVTVPGTVREVITVGCMDDGEVYGNIPGLKPGYSSRGPTKHCVVKPEILAPGTNIRSCSHRGGYTIKTGTSMAVPVVSGIVALMLAKNPNMTPAEVKLKFYRRCIASENNGKQECWGSVYVPYLLM